MSKRKRPKPIPEFRSEAEERQFWETHDSADYVDWSAARPVTLPNLRPSTETISLRLPAPLLADLKGLANKQDVPYQSLLKVYLAERVAAEWRRATVPEAPANKRLQPPKVRRARKPRPNKT